MENSNKENIKVSVIVPFYNTEKYISKCLESIINQSLLDIEIICVDDGSVDNSILKVKKYSKSDSRIKIIQQENKKQGAARNAGIKIAKGEYVGFVDSDDWIDADFFEKLYYAAKKFDSDIAMGTNVRIGGNKKTKKRLSIDCETFVNSLQQKFDISALAKNPCPTNKIYRREMLMEKDILFPENMYCEDKLFVTIAVYYAKGLVAVPDVNYYYFRNPTSTVNTRIKKHYKTILEDKEKARKDVLNFLKEKKAEIRDREFWAVKKIYNFKGLIFAKVMESLFYERFYLFGMIPLYERKI